MKMNINKSNQVVRDMKECFKSLQLPMRKGQTSDAYTFSWDLVSEICNENVSAILTVKYDRYRKVISINISFDQDVPPGMVTEVLKLLNLLNGTVSYYRYIIGTCSNKISALTGLYVSEGRLSKDKFRRLICDFLEDTYSICPLIMQLLREGGNPEEIYDRYMDGQIDGYRDLMSIDADYMTSMENKHTTEMDGNILDDIKSVFADFDITANDDDRVDDGFIIDLVHPKDQDLYVRFCTILDSENQVVSIYIAPFFAVPDNRFDVMMELVNSINRVCNTGHMFITRDNKHVWLWTEIMLDNGVIDKKELKNAFRTLLDNGCRLFPIIKEQLTFNESPDASMCRPLPCY